MCMGVSQRKKCHVGKNSHGVRFGRKHLGGWQYRQRGTEGHVEGDRTARQAWAVGRDGWGWGEMDTV